MKALIEPSGRIAEIRADTFPVHESLIWIDVPEHITTLHKYENGVFIDPTPIVVVDDPGQQAYPMPMDAHERDEVFVGRLRRDESQPRTLNAWIVSDNLRKGAATNAIQIAEYLAQQKMIK